MNEIDGVDGEGGDGTGGGDAGLVMVGGEGMAGRRRKR